MAVRSNRIERARAGIEARRGRVWQSGESQSEALAQAHSVVGLEPASSAPSASASSTPGAQGANHAAKWLSPDHLLLNSVFGRTNFNKAKEAEMKHSVGEHGILEPLLVRPLARPVAGAPQLTHELVAGYRRLKAATANNHPLVPVIERVMTDLEAAQISVSENLQREDPHPGDIGRALSNLKVQLQATLDDHVAQTAEAVRGGGAQAGAVQKGGISSAYFKTPAKSPAWVDAILKRSRASGRTPRVNWGDVGQQVQLSERSIMYYIDIAKLPPDVQEQISPAGVQEDGKLTFSQARAVASAKGEDAQRQVAHEALEKGLSRTEIEESVRRLSAPSSLEPPAPGRTHSSGTAPASAPISANGASPVAVEAPAARLHTLARAIEGQAASKELGAVLQVLEALPREELASHYGEAILRQVERIRAVRAHEEEELRKIEALFDK